MNEIYKIALIVGSIVAVIPFAIGVYQDAKKNLDEMDSRREEIKKKGKSTTTQRKKLPTHAHR